MEELIQALTKMQDEYLPLNHEKRREYYTEKRVRFNELKNGEKKKGDIVKNTTKLLENDCAECNKTLCIFVQKINLTLKPL